jgi:hypothetical protein
MMWDVVREADYTLVTSSVLFCCDVWCTFTAGRVHQAVLREWSCVTGI